MLLEVSRENEQLREEKKQLEAQLQDRELTISKAGSLAEAALPLNGVFQAAQDACDQYIYNTQLRCRKLEEATKSKCRQMLDETRNQVKDELAATPIVVVNKTGTELPSTGGVGTTLFYIIGGIMVLAAAVLLVTKKRMASAE